MGSDPNWATHGSPFDPAWARQRNAQMHDDNDNSDGQSSAAEVETATEEH